MHASPSSAVADILRAFAFALAIALSVALWGSPSHAAGPRVVEVAISGPDSDAETLRASMRELFGRLGLELRAIEPSSLAAPPAYDVVARVAIDVRSSLNAYIVLSDARGKRTPVMRSVALQGSRAVLLEEVAHVAQAATETMMSDEPPPASPAASSAPIASATPAPSPAPAPSARETTRDSPSAASPAWSLDLAVLANATAVARDVGAVFGVGAGAHFDLGREAWRPAIWLLGAYHVPFGSSEEPITLRASMWSVRLLPALQIVTTKRFLLEGAAGMGIDAFVISASGQGPQNTRVNPDRTDVSAIASAMVAAHLGLGATSEIFAALMLDWDLTTREYVFAGSTHESLLRPLRLRPSVSLGFTFDLVSADR